ncbi:nuclear transport factor 2 family protein [Bacteroidota bacterium]
MKQIAFLASALIFLVSCTPQAETETKEIDEVAIQNVEIVKKLIQTYETEDLDAMKELYTPDAVFIGPKYEDADTMSEKYWESMTKWFDAIDSMKFDVVAILPQVVEEGDLAGDWVLLWANIDWYETESGKTMHILYHSPIRLSEGKIVYEVSYWNQWDLYKQLGAELKWPEKE